MIRPISLALALAAATPAISAPAPLFDPARLSAHVRTLGSDAYEGRGVATRAEVKTLAYLIAQFRAAGLQPGGTMAHGKRGWTQAVPLLKADFTAPPSLIVKTATGPLTLVQGIDIAVRAPLTGQSSVTLAHAPLVFVGYGVTAPERGWDDFKGVDLEGKIAVLLINDPDFEGPTDADFGGKAMTYYGRWTYKYEEAARRGAAGVMIVHETAPAAYGWATVKNSNTNTMFDIVRDHPRAVHPAFESWIQRDVAVTLFKAAGLDFDAAKAAARRRDFRPIDLNAGLDATLAATVTTIRSHNVVGLLPGRKHPAETILYTAHWDHLGIGQPDASGDRIYNGAIDNGTGLAQLIEQGRAFAREPRPDRSIVFLAVTAEEKGLLGSEYYGNHPLYPAALTVADLNTDSMGVFGRERDFSIAGSARLDLLDLLVAEGARQGRRFTADPHPETGGFYRSDHFTLAKVGIPAISFKPGLDLVDGGTARGEREAGDYTAHRYHQPGDQWSAAWDFSGMAEDAALLHALGMRLANARDWPNWSNDSEFRAVRDKTASARR